MGDGDQLDLEGPEREASRHRDLRDLRLAQKIGLGQLAPQHRGGEGRGVDGAAQPRPEIGHGADMILMGMGQHEAEEIGAMLHDEGWDPA